MSFTENKVAAQNNIKNPSSGLKLLGILAYFPGVLLWTLAGLMWRDSVLVKQHAGPSETPVLFQPAYFSSHNPEFYTLVVVGAVLLFAALCLQVWLIKNRN